MTEPTVIPTIEIVLDGETRGLRYGFRAFKALNLNPFKPNTFIEFLGENLSELDIDKAAKFVQAGLLWEYAKGQPRHGQEQPAIEDLIDQLDFAKFNAIFGLLEASTNDPGAAEEPASANADPPPA